MKTPTALLISATLCSFLFLAGCQDKDDAVPKADSARQPDADNTARNVVDRDDATLTPGDQGTTPADMELTKKIRNTMVNTAAYSAGAKNVKIITVNGKVTLRGPVKTDLEKSGIAAIAKTLAGEGNLDDQLEVKANP